MLRPAMLRAFNAPEDGIGRPFAGKNIRLSILCLSDMREVLDRIGVTAAGNHVSIAPVLPPRCKLAVTIARLTGVHRTGHDLHPLRRLILLAPHMRSGRPCSGLVLV